MTPQERDLITALFDRLRQQGGVQKDAEAESLIRQGLQQQGDAGYLLVQTVLIQDMALHDAQNRIAQYERELAARTAPAAQSQSSPSSSFLPQRSQAPAQTPSGSAPSTGPWGERPADPVPPGRPVWSQSYAPPQAQPQPQAAPYAPPPYGGGYGPQMLAGGGGGFLRQAAATAAGVVGGSLLFQGISSMFGPHYGSGFMGGMPMQPGISETVINNYYNDPNNTPASDPGYANDPGYTSAAGDSSDPGYVDQQNFADDQDSGFDPGGDGGNYDA